MSFTECHPNHQGLVFIGMLPGDEYTKRTWTNVLPSFHLNPEARLDDPAKKKDLASSILGPENLKTRSDLWERGPLIISPQSSCVISGCLLLAFLLKKEISFYILGLCDKDASGVEGPELASCFDEAIELRKRPFKQGSKANTFLEPFSAKWSVYNPRCVEKCKQICAQRSEPFANWALVLFLRLCNLRHKDLFLHFQFLSKIFRTLGFSAKEATISTGFLHFGMDCRRRQVLDLHSEGEISS